MPDFSDVLLTVDFDRTLTAPDASIPQRNLDAIRFFIEHGGAFTINTGRSLAMYNKYRTIVPTNVPLLLFNGSAAYDTSGRSLPSAIPSTWTWPSRCGFAWINFRT